jgi:hypothetical protein
VTELARQSGFEQIAADVLLIGYPKAASTFITRFLANQPDVTVDEHRLGELLFPDVGMPTLVDKPSVDKVHVSRDENVAESVRWIRNRENWQRYLYVPGAWEKVRYDIVVDPAEVASRVLRAHPNAKILILVREQVDWLQSVYKYAISQLPWVRRSFADYCDTPSGIVMLQAGHFDRTIEAYLDVFGAERLEVLRFEDIVREPKRFAARLCAFVGIPERPLPRKAENETNVQLTRIQRVFPFVEMLPRNVKNALKPAVSRMLPGSRGAILSARDIRLLRSMYTVSNERTTQLIARLPIRCDSP